MLCHLQVITQEKVNTTFSSRAPWALVGCSLRRRQNSYPGVCVEQIGRQEEVMGMDPFNLRKSVTYGARCVVILSAILAAGCHRDRTSALLTTDQSTAATNGVRAFAAAVADDVTKRGPLAWSDHFATTPNFFMAAEGHLVFASGDAA